MIPILRAGLVMSEAMAKFIPNTSIYHVGLQRDSKTHRPICYYDGLPDIFENPTAMETYICDPMLATGRSICLATKMCIERGLLVENIKVLCIVSCPEGLKTVFETMPQIEIITASLDEGLDENGRIVFGLGDAGDRLYSTNNHE
jgi:uracil phosphoribosyltransferase